jgi:YfiH family protein
MKNKYNNNWLIPDWPASKNIQAVTTTRQGGVSNTPFDRMNLGDHVNDDSRAVQQNRQRLKDTLHLSKSPIWLKQIHSALISNLDDDSPLMDADAAVTTQKQQACVVMTADCLPVLFCDSSGSVVAAAHAGWRGLHASVLEKTVESMNAKPENIMAWLGPAIGPSAFEVGSEVRQAFMDVQAQAEKAFQEKSNGKWLADIYLLAKQRLNAIGVSQIYGGGECTYTDSERFYSYRREVKTGRMASLIWIEDK